MRLMVYSHDTFGLGNIRRMLAICAHLHRSIPDLSILIVSGSPMLQSFRILQGIDYIKLPCLKRTEGGDLGVRFLDLEIEEIVRLRRELILSTVASFQPDLVLVDKKPDGLAGEMEPSLRYIKCHLPHTKIFLVLRDILDTARATITQWTMRNYYNTVQWYYDRVLVLGDPRIFDTCVEYSFPPSLQEKVHFCGYVEREPARRSGMDIRKELGAGEEEKLVVVTAGGGEDGYELLTTAVEATRGNSGNFRLKTLIVAGPELAPMRAEAIREAGRRRLDIRILEFTDDMMSYLNAADVVVSMAGYNTVCELLTLRKRAVFVPRVRPVEEQKIRAERLAQFPLFQIIHPDTLTAVGLRHAIVESFHAANGTSELSSRIDLGALARISEMCSPPGLEKMCAGISPVADPLPELVSEMRSDYEC